MRTSAFSSSRIARARSSSRAIPYALWTTTTHPEDVERERKELQNVIEGRTNGYTMKKRHLEAGESRWRDFATQVVRDERGRVRYAIFHSIDSHEAHTAAETRERLEERLRQAQKLEAVGRLVGGVAHDFNNRLLVIMGYAELLKRGTVGDAELSGHADVVLTSARRAADLTHQLLAYGRRQVLSARAFDLNGVVNRMRRMFERVLGEQSIELVTVLGAKQQTLADPGQIEQVLMNLVSERARRDVGRRADLDRNRRRYRFGRSDPRARSWNVRDAFGRRHGNGRARGHARADLRAVLHDQRRGQGDGARACDGGRHRSPERRCRQFAQRRGARGDVHGVPAARDGAQAFRNAGGGARCRSRDSPRSRRCSSWTTKTTCAVCSSMCSASARTTCSRRAMAFRRSIS